MINAFIGRKVKQTQLFDEKGRRMPVTVITAGPCWVSQIKTLDTDGYTAVQLGFGTKQSHHFTKPLTGHIKKAGLEKQAPRFFREISIDESYLSENKLALGDEITLDQVFTTGDIISITGTSKGKGFAGVVKRHGFAGGPATHGQSDRLRAPGSIGGTTTPGRVYKGKRMAGRMGSDTITIKNLRVVAVNKEKNELTVFGLIPGPEKSLVTITITKKTIKPVQEPEPAAEIIEEKKEE